MNYFKRFLKGIIKRLTRSKIKIPKFSNPPSNFVINAPHYIKNPDRMYIGNDVFIGMNSILKAQKQYKIKVLDNGKYEDDVQEFDSRIVIGDRVSATSTLHIAAFKEIVIEDDVMMASNVFICDGMHGYENVDVPFKYQNITKIEPIRIKRGSWLGQNVVVMPGVTIGEFCVIGANSVVTKSVPDRCIAAGAPAKIIKKWDNEKKDWVVP